MDDRQIQVRVDSEIAPNQQPPIVIVAAPQIPHRRQPATSWFANAFAGTLGILTAIVLTLGLCTYVAVQYVWYRGASAIQQVQQTHEQTKQGLTQVFAPRLKKFGIVKISDDTAVFGGRYSGTGLDDSGKIHEFSIHYKSAKFGNKFQIEATDIWIDDKRVFPRGD